MTASAHYDRAEVLAAATAPDILSGLGVTARRAGDELRTSLCPVCGPRSTASVAINIESGRWYCHAHGCKGDKVALVAGLLGLDAARDFPAILERLAEIGGVSSSGPDPELARRVAERRQAEAAAAARDELSRAARRSEMPARWEALAVRHPIGEAYLARRELDPAALRAIGDVVRYAPNGDPAVALRDLESGAIVGIQFRHIAGAPKVTSLTGSQTKGAALYGRVRDLAPDGVDVAVATEGLTDALAALLTWRGCAVLGAPGQGELARVVAALAPCILACRGRLLIVADNDDAGIRGATAAVVAAVQAGLTLAPAGAGLDGASEVRLVDLGAYKDLADARRAGWRWTWPTATAGGAL